MECQQCGGECYDNRQKVANGWKGPLFKCKDQDGCGWKKWAPKGQKNGGGGNGNGKSAPAPRNTRPLGPLYNDCLTLAKRAVDKQLGDRASSADVIAAAATLFIAASRDGTALMPPPKREPEPEPEEEFEESGSYE